MQYLEGLRTCPNRGANARELLTMIASGKGAWEISWRGTNKEPKKNLYCPICCKCVFRVIPDRHPNCWCQSRISLFYRLPKRDPKKGGQHLCPICVSGQPFGSAEQGLMHMADDHTEEDLKKHRWSLWVLLRVKEGVLT